MVEYSKRIQQSYDTCNLTNHNTQKVEMKNMRGKLTWLLHFFTNMKLKNKMTLICTVSILLVSTAFLLAGRVVIESYNQVVYEKTADSLKATAQRIELYLKDTTTLSTVILSDSDIQQNLDVLSRPASGADQAAAVRNLSDRLTNYLSYHKYIVSISLVLDDYTIPVGKNISRNPKMCTAMCSKKHRNAWVRNIG